MFWAFLGDFQLLHLNRIFEEKCCLSRLKIPIGDQPLKTASLNNFRFSFIPFLIPPL